MVRHLVAFAALAASVASPLCGQNAAPKVRLTVGQVEAKVIPRMRGFDYLGPELLDGGAAYRLKFLRGPQTVWIDVDAMTGEILARGNGLPPSRPQRQK
jgi:hypothetical protein